MESPKFRVWWIPQIPMEPFYVPVRSLREAKLILNTLAEYDLFQLEKKVKPDYCNTGGLEVFDSADTTDGPNGSWVDWGTDDGDGIDDLTDEEVGKRDLKLAIARLAST